MTRTYAQLCPNSMDFLYTKVSGVLKHDTGKARLIIWGNGPAPVEKWFPNFAVRAFKLVPGGANQCTFKVLKSFIGES